MNVFMRVCMLVLAAAATAAGSLRAEPLVSHGLSAFGDLKYPADFTHFDYVEPDAPKCGSLVTTPVYHPVSTFDSLNPYIVRGDAAQGLSAPQNLLYDSLMTRAWDEPDAVYGLAASHVELVPGRWVIFQMRPEATFSDGSAVTAEDVAFTFESLKTEGRPFYQQMLADVDSVEALGPHRVKFTFNPDGATRDLPMVVGSLPILSKAWHQDRSFEEPYLDIPVGSGPYEIADVVPGRSITYRRRNDYWAADLPVVVGRFNFETISYRYYTDRDASRQALFAGELDLREEFTSKNWALSYDGVPAIESGEVVRDVLPDAGPSGAQGFWINTRRAKFADPRVREAIGLAFDFEWSNARLFYGLYRRTDSFFEGAPFEASGAPGEDELALIAQVAEEAPELNDLDIFGPAYLPPVSDGGGADRVLLRRAAALLNDAGWRIENGVRTNAAGESLSVEFLDRAGSGFDRIINPMIKNLRVLGIQAEYRPIDASQYQDRFKRFDFDVVTARYSSPLTPGPDLREFYGSESADAVGGRNLSGLRSPVVDALIERALAAEDRPQMETALQVLDRVLRVGHYWVPQWAKGSHTLAWRDGYARPEVKPLYDRGVLQTWWATDCADQTNAAADALEAAAPESDSVSELRADAEPADASGE